METKICAGCHEEKSLSAFYRVRRSDEKRRSQCKACVAAYTREYARAHPEKLRETRRRSQEKRRDYTRAYWGTPRADGVTRGAARMRIVRARDPEAYRAYQREQKRRWRAAKRAERTAA